MYVKKTSWHYKLVMKRGNKRPSESLCKYFWQVSSIILTRCLLVFLLFSFSIVFSAPIANLFIDVGPIAEFGVVAYIVAASYALLLTVGFVIVKVYQVIDNHRYECSGGSDILKSYIKATKEKACPIIKFTD